MKYGVADYGMLVWYGGHYDYEWRIDEIRKIGFDGRLNRQRENGLPVLITLAGTDNNRPVFIIENQIAGAKVNQFSIAHAAA